MYQSPSPSTAPQPPQLPHTHNKKFWIAAGVIAVILLIALSVLFSEYLGAKVAPGRAFKILGPSTVQAGQIATITWDTSTDNAVKYPNEKIEYCYGSLLKKKCVVLASKTKNNGKAVVKVPSSLPAGKGNFQFTGISTTPSKLKVLGTLVSKSGTITVKPAKVATNENSGGGGGSGGGGSGGGGGGSSSGGGSNPTPTPSTAGVHISYMDSTTNNSRDLKYATNVSGGWVATTVDAINSVGEYTDVATDSHGKVHISYQDITDGKLKYATNTSGSWVTTVVNSSGVSSGDTSIALDSNDKVHISYFEAAIFQGGAETSDLKYATNASGSWVITTVDSTGRVGEYSSIAVDRNNKIHISYADTTGSNSYLKYATNISGSWVNTVVDAESGAGAYSSIAIDSQNKAHISYVKYTGASTPDTVLLRYATNSSGSWVVSTVDASGFANYTSLKLDASDKAHIAYYDVITKDLRYATNTSGAWATSTIDSTGDVGQFVALALDNQGKVHISYYDQTNIDLKYSTNLSGSWVASTIDSAGSVGAFTSIGVSQ